VGKREQRSDPDPAGLSCISSWDRTARTAVHSATPAVVPVVPALAGLEADEADVDCIGTVVFPGIAT
jgi:hypothetical protein